MAKFAKALGGNWSSASTWSATSSAGVDNAGAPSASDAVIFDSGSIGAVTVDTTTCVALSVTFQSALNSIVYTAAKILTVSGDYTQYAGMSVTGTGKLVFNATGNLTSAGITFPGAVTFNVTATYALVDSWTVTGVTTITTAILATVNGNTLTCNGGLTATGGRNGTTDTVLGGGVWSSSNATNGMSGNVTIAGNITLANAVMYYKTGTITYVSGTVTIGGTNTQLAGLGDFGLNTTGMKWGGIYAANPLTITLYSNLSMTVLYIVADNITFAGNYDITIDILGSTTIALADTTTTFVSGRTVSVTTVISLGMSRSSTPYNWKQTIKSSTASSPFYLNYQGTVANCSPVYTIFTDVDASGSAVPIYVYKGVLTRTSNIFNLVIPPNPGNRGILTGGAL